MKILVADDHPVVLDGLRTVFSAEPDFELAGEAHDGTECLKLVQKVVPDVLVLDLMMPGTPGLEVAARIRETSPRTNVVVLSMHANVAYAAQALANGAQGYVLKNAPSSELIAAIRTVAAGGRFVSAAISKQELATYEARLHSTQIDPFETLTAREREVVALTGEGIRTSDIAKRLSIGIRTVESHRANAMRKLGIHAIVELARYAISRGLAKPE